MPLHLGVPHGHHHTQEAAREARRQLQARVRNDWDYPSLPQSAAIELIEEEAHATPSETEIVAHTVVPLYQAEHVAPVPSRELDFEPTGWREPEYSSVESADEQSASDAVAAANVRSRPTTGYTYESPDSVGDVISERRLARKRKRRRRLDEEMGWNVGLAHFVARRNAWTCAQSTSSVRQTIASASGNTATEGVSDPTSASMTAPTINFDADTHTLLPMPPPLLPDHPVRTKINHSTYSEIYSKIIVQGRTPSVPINLSDVTRSLVAGWKENGEWPPRPSAPEPIIAGKKKKPDGSGHHLKKSVQAVGRVLGLHGTGTAQDATNGQHDRG